MKTKMKCFNKHYKHLWNTIKYNSGIKKKPILVVINILLFEIFMVQNIKERETCKKKEIK